jgi:PAS domain S-box-containing protein
LAADGLTDKEIAKSLGLSLKTVGTYWDRMRHKFSASSRTQVLAHFLRIQVADDQQAGRLDRLFATWEEGVWVLGKNAETIYANQRVSELFGLHGQQVEQKRPTEVVGPTNASKVRKLLTEARTTPCSIELAMRDATDDLRWLTLTAAPFEDQRGRLGSTVLLVKDITVRKRVEYALESCESSMKLLMDYGSDLVAQFDGEMRLTYVNDSFRKMMSLTEKELLGKSVSDLPTIFAPNARWIRTLEKALKSGHEQQCAVSLAGIKGTLTTYVIPQPSGDFLPQSVITLTRSENGALLPKK